MQEKSEPLEILNSLKLLCDETRMLSCLSASYGTADRMETVRYGRAREMDEAGLPEESPLTANALFDLASLTKFITGLLVMRLWEEGKVSLEETIRNIDPRFVNLGETKLGDVLCYLASLQTEERVDAADSPEEGMSRLFAIRRGPTPATRIYSDMNAMVCKYVVEARTGLSLFEAMEHMLFRPLGMTDTHASIEEKDRPRCVSYDREHQIVKGNYVVRTGLAPGTVNDPKARLLSGGGRDLCGHAGLFSTEADMARLCQGLLSGEFIRRETLCEMGKNRTGRINPDGSYRQYMGYLCFTRHPIQRLSELPSWMGEGAIGLSGFTGNHLCIDPEQGFFLVYLGNRCHGRVSRIILREGERYSDFGLKQDGTGFVCWPDGRAVPCSAEYVHLKDDLLHRPVFRRLDELGLTGRIHFPTTSLSSQKKKRNGKDEKCL